MSTKTILLLCALGCAGNAYAQTVGVVTLRANQTSAQTSMVPVLTWSTNPVATSCSASGGWSGNKAVSGTQTLPSITSNTNYTLTCTWGTGSARVGWRTPTTNSNGSTLTNLAGYRVYYGTSSTSFPQSSAVSDITSQAATITSLAPGTWYFKVRTMNTNQRESVDSNIASKSVTGDTSAGTASITITQAPPPPPPPNPTTRTTIGTPVYDVIRGTSGRWELGRVVGTIAIGRACRTYYLNADYYGVLSGFVRITVTPRTSTLVAHCAFN